MLAYIPYMDPMGTRLSHGDIASEMFDPNTLALLVAVVVLQIAIRHRSKKGPVHETWKSGEINKALD